MKIVLNLILFLKKRVLGSPTTKSSNQQQGAQKSEGLSHRENRPAQVRKQVTTKMRPLWPEIKVDLDNIEGLRGTGHASKDGPICSGKFPATPNELEPRHQANLPVIIQKCVRASQLYKMFSAAK